MSFTTNFIEIDTVADASVEQFVTNIYPKRVPVILQGFDLGDCMKIWTPDYLASQRGSQEVKVHVCASAQMDFLKKNFLYRSLPFQEFIERVFKDEHSHYFIDQQEKYYLRALGEDPRKDVADISAQFPQLASDLNIPPLFEKEKIFSSVFRIASRGVQLWTHYDIMDNILIQIVGKKKVILFHPEDVDYLYLNGDKSEVIDLSSPDEKLYPKFAKARQYRGYLNPGDILFIPALWFHNIMYEDAGIAVNVFWRHLNKKFYDTKDLYGNHDLLPAQKANQIMDRAIKALEELPEEYKEFYARRLVNRIRDKFSLENTL